MAEKLYPPYIDSSLPAQAGAVLTIPFQPNRSANVKDYSVVKARIKTVSTNWQVGDILTGALNVDSEGNIINPDFPTLIFTLNNPSQFVKGQFYKIQIAGVLEDIDGYYSTIGIFKYTTMPELSIDISDNDYVFMGIYNQPDGDKTEKVYSYCFDLYENDNIILSSGTLIHDSSTDMIEGLSQDKWEVKEYFIQDIAKTYTIQYSVTTINGLYCKSDKKPLKKIPQTNNDFVHCLVGYNNYENGFIEIQLQKDTTKNLLLNGKFLLCRSSSLDNHQTKIKIKEIQLSSNKNQEIIFQDFSVEQGIEYQYYIAEISALGWSKWAQLSSPIKADFEDMFLYDGNRQLKIKFNPQISSFKTVLQESKLDTIGNKYPFIFRNGNVAYKQFPISGLISYLMDNDELFMLKDKIGFFGIQNKRDLSPSKVVSFANTFQPDSTQLDTQNIAKERIFKTEVLNWLNNGEIKLFRSPTEGNFIIRLMDVSLSPNTTLGRMLHTFSATAYEMKDCSITTLKDYNFIK